MLINYLFIASLLACYALSQALYNHDPLIYRNRTWMSAHSDNFPLRRLNILGTHSSMAYGPIGDSYQTQASSLGVQLEAGIRALDIRCRHYMDRFMIYQRDFDLNINFSVVLNTVQNFLTTYTSEVILMHVIEQHTPASNTRTFQQTFIQYKNNFSTLIWHPSTQNPTLGMTRGKVVLIQNFPGNVHGLLKSSFTTHEHKTLGNNFDLYDHWISVKNFIMATTVAQSSRINFWSGSGGSYPYFVASGNSNPANNAPKLPTELTTPAYATSYPQFPRSACILMMCTITFQGINILGSSYLQNYTGIIFLDFPGETLVSQVIQSNFYLVATCTPTQISRGCTMCIIYQCVYCNEALHYYLQESNMTCMASPGYYLDSSFIPTPCYSTMPGCQLCSSATVCTLCNATHNYILSSTRCQAADGYYLDSNSMPTLCNMFACRLCSSATSCTGCLPSPRYVLTSGTCSCNGALNWILSADGLSCFCDNSTMNLFYAAFTQSCELCTLPGCLTCTSATTCLACNLTSMYYMQNSSSVECSYCNSSENRFVNLTSTECQLCNLEGCVVCLSLTECSVCDGNYTYDAGTRLCVQRLCQIEGCVECINADTCRICLDNYTINNAGKCSSCLSCKCLTGSDLPSSVIPTTYSQQQCQSYISYTILIPILYYSSLGIMFVSLLSRKMIGLELLGVLQLAHINLASNSHVNLFLSPIFRFKVIHGYNQGFVLSSDPVPDSLTAIQYRSSFLENVNFMLIPIFTLLFLGTALKILSKKIPILTSASTIILKNMLPTLLIFNSLNITFSIGIHFRYSTFQNTHHYIPSTCLAIMCLLLYVGMMVYLEVGDREYFGQFKDSFKESCLTEMYVFWMLAYRVALGLYLGCNLESKYNIMCTFYILTLPFTYILYNITNLPYKHASANYRANICHITQLVTLLVTNYYECVKYGLALQLKAQLHIAAHIEVVMLAVCVGVSAGVVVWWVGAAVRRLCRQKRNKVEHKQSRNQISQVSMKNTLQ